MKTLNKFKQLIRHTEINTRRNLSSTTSCPNKNNVVIQKHFNVTMIGINRPSKRNCLNSETFGQLINELQTFDEDVDAKVAILHGEGGNFCSGFDLEEIMKQGYDSILKTIGNLDGRPLCKKPVIGAINGFAVAEGFELALACDLRVIEDTASMGALGRRFGAPMLLGGAKRLSDLVGASRALDLILSGRAITGTNAHEWGLAARSVGTGTSLGQALNLAQSIAKYPSNGLQYDKLNLYERCMSHDKEWIAQNKGDLKTLKVAAIKDLEINAVRFIEGIGKHGKFRNLVPKEFTSWEMEDDLENKKQNNESLVA